MGVHGKVRMFREAPPWLYRDTATVSHWCYCDNVSNWTSWCVSLSPLFVQAYGGYLATMLLSSEEFTQLKCGTAVSPITDFELYGITSQICFIYMSYSWDSVWWQLILLTLFISFLNCSVCIFRTIPRLKDRFPGIYGKFQHFLDFRVTLMFRWSRRGWS